MVRRSRLSDVSVFWGVVLGELVSMSTLAIVCGWDTALIVFGALVAIVAGAVIYAGWWLHTWSEPCLSG